MTFPPPPRPCRLWKSDGTADGTVQLETECPGVRLRRRLSHSLRVKQRLLRRPWGGRQDLGQRTGPSTALAWPRGVREPTSAGTQSPLVDVNGTLYYQGSHPTNGSEMWKTDGVTCTLVADLSAGRSSSDPQILGSVGNLLLLRRGRIGQTAREPWISDGTAAGTTLLKDINTGTGDANPSLREYAAGDNLVFVGRDGTTDRIFSPPRGGRLATPLTVGAGGAAIFAAPRHSRPSAAARSISRAPSPGRPAPPSSPPTAPPPARASRQDVPRIQPHQSPRDRLAPVFHPRLQPTDPLHQRRHDSRHRYPSPPVRTHLSRHKPVRRHPRVRRIPRLTLFRRPPVGRPVPTLEVGRHTRPGQRLSRPSPSNRTGTTSPG